MLATATADHVVKRMGRIVKVQKIETVVYACTADGQFWNVQAVPGTVHELQPGAWQRIKRWWLGAGAVTRQAAPAQVRAHIARD